jgi:hypothetical protein
VRHVEGAVPPEGEVEALNGRDVDANGEGRETAVTLIGCVGGKARVPKAAITLRVTATDAAKNVSTPELLAVKNV